VESFATEGLTVARIEDLRTQPDILRWRAEFIRHPD
jgi:hypothetical protein